VKPAVVIVGAGFGGLRAARALRKAPVDVVLLDRNNYHLFQPLLYQVATAGLEPEQIARPVRAILRGQENFEFRMVTVTGVDVVARQLATDNGPVRYDYLVLAVGGETNYFGLESIVRHGFGLKGVIDAVAIRNHVLLCFERAMLEPDTERRGAVRIGAHRRRAQVALAEVGVSRSRWFVAPRVPAGPAGCRVVAGRLFPLRLGGQPLSGPRRVGLRLVEAQVHDGLLGHDRRRHPESGVGPAVSVAPPGPP